MTLKWDESACAGVPLAGRAAARSDVSQAIQNLCENPNSSQLSYTGEVCDHPLLEKCAQTCF